MHIMAFCHTVLLMAPLFRLGSGAGVPSVPTHEPNLYNNFFDKAAVQNGTLTKNNFDAGNFTDDNNKKMMNELSSPTSPTSSSTTYFYDVYMVLHSLVFPGQTGHHDFSPYFYRKNDSHLRGRRVQAAKAPAGAPGATPVQYLSKIIAIHSKKHITVLQGILIGLSMGGSIWLLTSICHMFPGTQHQAGQATKANPPRWGPEMEGNYNFTEYMKDTQLWQMSTDIAPHQQAAIIILNLSGEARALARQIPTNELANGGMYEGRMLDPVTYLFKQLQKRFGMLTVEKRMIAV